MRQGLALRAGIHPLADFNQLVGGGSRLGHRDQTRGSARDADHGTGHTLQQAIGPDGDGSKRLRDLSEHLHGGIEAERLLAGLLEEEGIFQRDGHLGAQRGGELDVVVAAEGAVALVRQHQHTERPPARAERNQQHVAVAKGLRQQLTGLDVVQAVLDDDRLLGDEDAPDQG